MQFVPTVLACWLILVLGGAGHCLEVVPSNPVPPFTLVRVSLAEGERAWVLGSDLLPVDVAKTPDGIVFTGKPGRYAILAFSESTQDQRIVEIAGTSPNPPTPPGPDPPDPPTPPPHPVPTDLVNKYGLGLVSWEQALIVGKPAEARTLSQAYLAMSSALHENRVTIDAAASAVRDARRKLSSGWDQWERAVEPLLIAAANTNGTTVAHYRNYLYEIGKSLEIAGRSPVAAKPAAR